MALFVAAIVFFGCLFLALSLYYLWKDRLAREKARLLGRLTSHRETGNEPLLKKEKAGTRLEALLGGLVDLSLLENLLTASGNPFTVQRFFGLSVGSALVLMLPAVAIFRNPTAALLLSAVGLCFPYFYLLHRRRKWEQALVGQLPDALEMITRALRIGQSVGGALKEVGFSLPPPVGSEIRMIHEEVAIGLSFDRALRNFEKRFPGIPDIKIFCTALIIQRETGGNLTRTLEGLSDTIRSRFQLKRQVRAFTSESRASALIIGLLPLFFALLTYLFNPSYITRLLADPLGRKLAFLAILLEAAGFGVMRLMTRIEV